MIRVIMITHLNHMASLVSIYQVNIPAAMIGIQVIGFAVMVEIVKTEAFRLHNLQGFLLGKLHSVLVYYRTYRRMFRFHSRQMFLLHFHIHRHTVEC